MKRNVVATLVEAISVAARTGSGARPSRLKGISNDLLLVIPAQAGIQWRHYSAIAKSLNRPAKTLNRCHWIPACAGMTIGKTEVSKDPLKSLLQHGRLGEVSHVAA